MQCRRAWTWTSFQCRNKVDILCWIDRQHENSPIPLSHPTDPVEYSYQDRLYCSIKADLARLLSFSDSGLNTNVDRDEKDGGGSGVVLLYY